MRKFVKILTTGLLCVALAVLAAGCAKDGKTDENNQGQAAGGKKPTVTISVENFGDMTFELDPAAAPITVENFIKLAKEGYYEGSTFHRIISGFMIQGGINESKEAQTIKGEFSQNGVENPLKHTRGTISMARTNVPDSASSQFFICHADAPSLDGLYAAFGQITDGLDVLDAIAAVEVKENPMTGELATPVTPVKITKVTVKE